MIVILIQKIVRIISVICNSTERIFGGLYCIELVIHSREPAGAYGVLNPMHLNIFRSSKYI